MNILRIFGIGDQKIREKNNCVTGSVTSVRSSWLHVLKKPVRIGNNPDNTIFSHFITFTYEVDGTSYSGIRFVDLRYRCPGKDEKIDVYYDPETPGNYALAPFGPGVNPIGW